jgi:hypothetical protein
MPVDDADDADHAWIDLVIDSIGKLPQENAPESPADQWVALRSLVDQRERVLHCIEEMVGCRWRVPTIPSEGSIDVGPRDLANAEPSHLPELPLEILFDLRPRLPGLRIGIGLGFAAIEFRGQGVRNGRRASGIQAVPQSAHELNALFRRQIVHGKGA